jgi:phosphate transport system protein
MPPEVVERKVFSEGLQQLNDRIVRMAALSQQAVRKAVDGLVRRDIQECKDVFAIDRQVYQYQREIDQECTDLIALHAPVAKDLRTIMTTLKISTDIDRIGRGARNLAEVGMEIAAFGPVSPSKLAKLTRNADLAIHMVDQAVRAFVDRNDHGVREMARFDDAVDELHQEIFADIIAGLKDRSLKPEVGVRLALANRYIERMADHAVNIADRVVYMVSGQTPPWPAEHDEAPAVAPGPEGGGPAPEGTPPPPALPPPSAPKAA